MTTRFVLLWIGLCSLASRAGWAQQYLISTYAGGALPAEGEIGVPLGVAVDTEGSVYFTSTLNFVFKRDSSGTLTRIAGNFRSGSWAMADPQRPRD